jgi:hypothetical protein
MTVNEILVEAAAKMVKAAKQTPAQKLAAVEDGQKPDAALEAFIRKMTTKAEKTILARAAADPDAYGLDYDVKGRDVRANASVWTQRLYLHEKGFMVDVNIDLDDIGGDSTNYEEVFFTLDGKISTELSSKSLGKEVAMFDANEDFARSE